MRLSVEIIIKEHSLKHCQQCEHPQMRSYTLKTLRPWYKDWLLVPIVILVYILDQITKFWVERQLCPFGAIPNQGPLRITCTYNSGSAFGLFNDQTIFLIFSSFIAIGVMLWIYHNYPTHGHLLRLSLGLQLGGATGNLTDRILFGQVTDFIQIGFWPVFNLADSSIVVGVSILGWLLIFKSRTQVAETENTTMISCESLIDSNSSLDDCNHGHKNGK